MAWVLIFWMLIDRGGGPAVAEFTTKDRCEAAGQAVFSTAKYRDTGNQSKQYGNYICVEK